MTCTCVVTGTVSQTWWIFNHPCPGGLNNIPFLQVAPCSSSDTCGPHITATNMASTTTTSCQTSKLKVAMFPGVSGLKAECRDFSYGLPGMLSGNASFILQGVFPWSFCMHACHLNQCAPHCHGDVDALVHNK